MSDRNVITYTWRGEFSNVEIHAVHAEAFETRLYDESEWNWVEQCERYSLGWVVARDGSRFVGFVNVLGTASCTPISKTSWCPPRPATGVSASVSSTPPATAPARRVRVPPRELRRGAAHLLRRRLRVRTRRWAASWSSAHSEAQPDEAHQRAGGGGPASAVDDELAEREGDVRRAGSPARSNVSRRRSRRRRPARCRAIVARRPPPRRPTWPRPAHRGSGRRPARRVRPSPRRLSRTASTTDPGRAHGPPDGCGQAPLGDVADQHRYRTPPPECLTGVPPARVPIADGPQIDVLRPADEIGRRKRPEQVSDGRGAGHSREHGCQHVER